MPNGQPVMPPAFDRREQERLLEEYRARIARDRGCGIFGAERAGAPFIRPVTDAVRPDVPFRPPNDLLPQRMPSPTGAGPSGYSLDANTAALNRLAAAMEAQYQLQRVQQRIRLLQIMGDPNLPPTYFAPNLAGNVITAAAGQYIALWTNDRKYPVGFQVLAIWATAGASIRISLNPSDNGWYQDIANGGPAGGYGVAKVWLNPRQIVYVRDLSFPASPMQATDIIHRLVSDPNDYLQDANWMQDMGWTLGVKP